MFRQVVPPNPRSRLRFEASFWRVAPVARLLRIGSQMLSNNCVFPYNSKCICQKD